MYNAPLFVKRTSTQIHSQFVIFARPGLVLIQSKVLKHCRLNKQINIKCKMSEMLRFDVIHFRYYNNGHLLDLCLPSSDNL